MAHKSKKFRNLKNTYTKLLRKTETWAIHILALFHTIFSNDTNINPNLEHTEISSIKNNNSISQDQGIIMSINNMAKKNATQEKASE